MSPPEPRRHTIATHHPLTIRTTPQIAEMVSAMLTAAHKPDHPDSTAVVTLQIDSSVHVVAEPAHGYYWRGANYHPSCLITEMVRRKVLSPAAQWDMTPAEALRQRLEADPQAREDPAFHIEPCSTSLGCHVCALPWGAE